MLTTLDLIRRIRDRRAAVEGELGHFGLGGWWLSAFTRAERKHIEASYQPAGSPGNAKSLTTGQGHSRFHSSVGLLTALAAQLRSKPEDRDLASRVLVKAEQRARAEDDVIGLHLVYQEMIRLHAKWRDYFLDALDLAFGACHKQIMLAPAVAEAIRATRPDEPLPGHLGFQKMAVFLEKEGSYTKAIETCKQAREQGWDGNWTWRIGTLAKKREEQGCGVTYISRSHITPI